MLLVGYQIMFQIADSLSMASIFICLLMAWQSTLLANDMRQSSEVSYTLGIPFYPFVYGIAVCSVLLALVFLVDLLDSITQMVRE